MTQTELRRGFEALPAAECRRLLATSDIGRLAVSSGALPIVLPVQYRIRADRLLLRTPGFHRFGDDLTGHVVGFEADHLPGGSTGWCVTVTGPVRTLSDVADLVPRDLWFSGGCLLELGTEVISGHRGAR